VALTPKFKFLNHKAKHQILLRIIVNTLNTCDWHPSQHRTTMQTSSIIQLMLCASLLIAALCILAASHVRSKWNTFGSNRTPTAYMDRNIERGMNGDAKHALAYSEWRHQMDTGKKECAETKIIIMGLVRDKASHIAGLRERSERLGAKFADYHVLVVENDSSDNTRAELLRWHHEDPSHITVLGCGENVTSCKLNLSRTAGHTVSAGRIEKMVYLRTLYMNYARDHMGDKFADFKYSLVIDMDLVASLYDDGIYSTFYHFGSSPAINAISAYGKGHLDAGLLDVEFYHDPYAHEDMGESDSNGNSKVNALNKFLRDFVTRTYSYSTPLQPVQSCFGGATFYRLSALLSAEYSTWENPHTHEFVCEHVGLHKSMTEKYMNPRMVLDITDNDYLG
jgi:glycosyltransferase involved in cell wall biosynthesis